MERFIGITAPDFDLPGIDGNNVSLDALIAENNLVVVIFSCNHCPYVKAYEERMVKIQAAYMERGVSLVAINPNNDTTHPDDSFEKMKIRAAEREFNFPYLRDEGAVTAKAYKASFTPECFLVDKEKVVRYHGRIDDCWSSERRVKRHDLKEAMEDILHNRDVAVKNTTPIGCTIKWPQP